MGKDKHNVDDELKKQIQQRQNINEALKKVLKGLDESTQKEVDKKLKQRK